jgi:hypothetical protein
VLEGKVKQGLLIPFFRFINIIKLTCLVIVHVVNFTTLLPPSPMFSTMGHLFLMIKGGLPKVDFSS